MFKVNTKNVLFGVWLCQPSLLHPHVHQVRVGRNRIGFLAIHPNITFLGECKTKPTANIRKTRRAFGA